MSDETCVYCGLPALGYASDSKAKGRLCHDERRDCYHVVTVYRGDWARFARTLKFKEQADFVRATSAKLDATTIAAFLRDVDDPGAWA